MDGIHNDEYDINDHKEVITTWRVSTSTWGLPPTIGIIIKETRPTQTKQPILCYLCGEINYIALNRQIKLDKEMHYTDSRVSQPSSRKSNDKIKG